MGPSARTPPPSPWTCATAATPSQQTTRTRPPHPSGPSPYDRHRADIAPADAILVFAVADLEEISTCGRHEPHRTGIYSRPAGNRLGADSDPIKKQAAPHRPKSKRHLHSSPGRPATAGSASTAAAQRTSDAPAREPHARRRQGPLHPSRHRPGASPPACAGGPPLATRTLRVRGLWDGGGGHRQLGRRPGAGRRHRVPYGGCRDRNEPMRRRPVGLGGPRAAGGLLDALAQTARRGRACAVRLCESPRRPGRLGSASA